MTYDPSKKITVSYNPRWRGFAIRAYKQSTNKPSNLSVAAYKKHLILFYPEDYVYSGAAIYSGGKGLIEVTT